MTDRLTIQAGESVLFIDHKEREYLRTLRPGSVIALRGGNIPAEQFIGLPEGSLIRVGQSDLFRILRPTYAHLIPNLPRQAQVIYPKDIGPMLLWGDVYPGARVLEIGSGPGALTMALLRAIGADGHLLTVDIRTDHCKMARNNVKRFVGATPNWTLAQTDAYRGLPVQSVDRIFIDLPEPWQVLPHARTVLRPGGVLVGYSPTVLQVKSLVDALHADPVFESVEVMENMLRFWHVKDISIRPEHRMVAHTGFIMVARRVTDTGAITVKSEKQLKQEQQEQKEQQEAQQAEALANEPE